MTSNILSTISFSQWAMLNNTKIRNSVSSDEEINSRPLRGAEHSRNNRRVYEQRTLDGRIIQDKARSQTKPRWMFPETICLKNIRSWKKLFGGFKVLRGVTYVTSPSYLLTLFSDYDFEEVDLVVGGGMMDGYKKKLEGCKNGLKMQKKSYVIIKLKL